MVKDTNFQSRFPQRFQIKEELLCVIAERGGSIKIQDRATGWSIYEELANRLNLSDEARTRMRDSKKPEKKPELAWENEVRWCRTELGSAGLIEKDKVNGQGIWTLTNLGRESVENKIENKIENTITNQKFSFPEEVPPDTVSFHEGSVTRVLVNRYERNPIARQQCINYYGKKCFVCGFEFARVYGTVAEDLIHVHHLKALSEIAEEYEVDPIADLRPVCPNCHAVLHLRFPPYSIEEVQGFLHQEP
ncbi:hypothetical protein F7734_24800 [Scytonema sp. UIC 10036]|uniref:winged helix-turn-helix domain-containing protein n=1 Tax=Scytonema sp. UIC 10036 TaxID=2304196 RepID=UPI0012DA1C09|nr:winged helix-turn-helix domain-containing protein [Scytonema sp. UIC 10036]MUG95407.1 hypothetical protein [Scytonema sp. UIC 10036]